MNSMGVRLKNQEFNDFLQSLKPEYLIYGPKRFQGRGRFSDTDIIRYGEIDRVEDIVWKEKSHFSPKEIIFPITQTLFYFTGDGYQEPTVTDKKIIIFLRPCDIHGIRKLDILFLTNGGQPDYYYQRLREKVKFVMIECKDSFENCFCVSMKTNYTEDYSLAVSLDGDEINCEIRDEVFSDKISKYGVPGNYRPQYVQANPVKVELPPSDKMTIELFNHKLWQEYNRRCIACGRCNTTCITCSCFTMQDVAYEENPNAGERRRVWAGCHIDKFTDMAGGHSFRQDFGSRMRFKTMHKIYDFHKRFGEHQCVGCGRCDDQCPEYISFSSCLNKVNNAVKGGEKDA